jgi:hypothetical protein
VNELSADTGAFLVCCFDLHEPPYGGMRIALGELERAPAFAWRAWDGAPLHLGGLENLSHVVLSGHGSETHARLGDGVSRFLYPRDVGVPRDANLYLLGCFQGREDFAPLWSRDTGVPPERIFGAEGETETLLSTMFLLHLAEEGFADIKGLFEDWVLANRIIRPKFNEARALYAETGGDPLKVLDFLSGAVDLTPVLPFLEIARKRADVLSGLLP